MYPGVPRNCVLLGAWELWAAIKAEIGEMQAIQGQSG